MAGQSDISIIAKFLLEGKQDMAELRDGLKNSETQSKSFGDQLRDVGLTLSSWMGIAEQAGQVAKEAFEFAEQGAALERLGQASAEVFRQMGGDINEAVAAIKAASLGSISDYEAMASASRAALLGVSADAETLGKLMEIAAFRGRAMGVSTAQAFDDITRGIGRNSPLILDNLGIITKGWNEEAAAAGEAFDAHFILNKVLEQGGEQLKEAGGLAADSATTFERWRAEIKNTTDAIKIMTSDAIEPMLAARLDEKDVLQSNLEAYTKLTGEVITSRAQYNMHREEIEKAGESYKRWMEIIDQSTESFDRSLLNYQATSTAITEIGETAEEASKRFQGYLDITTNIADENQRHADKLDDITQKMQENRAAAEELYPWETEKIDEINGKYEDLKQQYVDEQNAHTERTNKILYDLLLQKLSMDGLTDTEYQMALQAGLTFGIFDEKAVQSAQNMDTVVQAVLDGRIGIEDMGRALQELPDKKTIDVYINAHGDAGLLGIASGGEGNAVRGQGVSGYRASGGPVFGANAYGVTEKGIPELLTMGGNQYLIMPPGQDGYITAPSAGGGGGGSVVIQLNYYDQSAVSLGDAERAGNALLPLLESGVRKLQADGVLPA